MQKPLRTLLHWSGTSWNMARRGLPWRRTSGSWNCQGKCVVRKVSFGSDHHLRGYGCRCRSRRLGAAERDYLRVRVSSVVRDSLLREDCYSLSLTEVCSKAVGIKL